ncbi:MAG: FAD-dependent oxidoreductase [Bacilli bacterium]|nr:FAD-dependent oxidoreductase [Bacilli bacterium]
MERFDVLIIGAGVTGAMIARNLAKYDVKVALLDKENDVGNLTSNANSAIIHSGYDPLPGTNKAKFNVLGNKMFDEICEDLDVNFYRVGSLTVALYDEQLPLLKELAERSKQNGVEVKLLSAEEVKKMEPNINPNVKGALFAPTAGIVDVFNFVVHAVENAVDNGVKLFLNEEVTSIVKEGEYYKVKTQKEEFYSKVVINAAGCYADKIASMVEPIDWKITPRKGEYFVLDHYKEGLVNHVIFPLPSEKGKGILVTMTTSGNYLVGPSSELTDEKDDYRTDPPTLKNVRAQASEMVPSIPFNQVIRVFAGNRPTCTRHDFVIEYSKKDKNFINVGGIESPGFVSSPAIGEYVVEQLVKPILSMKEKANYNPKVRKYHRLYNEMREDNYKFSNEHLNYSEIICNCEKVTLGEILDVLSRSNPPHSVKALKRRTRAGFGKCQGGFCQPRVVLILAKYYGVSPLEINYDGEFSPILLEKIKGGR